MPFGINFVTDTPAAVTSNLEEHGIACTIWNPSACSASSPVELQLGFESQQDLMAAKTILGISEQQYA